MKKVLISAFEPFDNAKTNPSYEAAKLLPSKIGEVELTICQLPVVFEEGAAKLKERIDEIKPDIVIMLGVAGNRTKITPEVIAINMDDARIPDNNGNSPKWEKIEKNGPDGVFSTLPVKEMTDALEAEGINAEPSFSAGAYVCNDLFYRIMRYIETGKMNIPSGFIHVPNPSDSNSEIKSGMSIKDIAKGLSICIKVASESYK